MPFLPPVSSRLKERVILALCILASLALLLAGPKPWPLARSVAAFLYGPSRLMGELRRDLVLLRGENDALRQSLMDVAAERSRVQEYRKETERLQAIIGLSASEPETFLPARLLSFPLSFAARNLVRIDRGLNDGVREGMPVVDHNGLVGRVFAVQPAQAEVLLLASKDFSVSCRDTRSRVLGVFKWTPRLGYHVDWIDRGDDVQVGDRFITSGLGNRFRAGYMLGSVTALERDSSSPRLKVFLAPAAGIRSLEDVFVVLPAQRPEAGGGE